MNFSFRLTSIKLRKNMYNYILNNQSNTYMQNTSVVAPSVAPSVVPSVAPVISTNNKLPKKGFNVVLSQLN